MKWQQLVNDQFERIERELGLVLEGLTVDDLNRQPAPDCNSIGWLAWHRALSSASSNRVSCASARPAMSEVWSRATAGTIDSVSPPPNKRQGDSR
jgi:hypothetical protein